MAFAVRLHTLVDNTTDPEIVGSVDCEATDSYMQFRRLLEDISIVDWPFFFWYNANHCTINPKLERVNKVQIDVFLIANEESGGFSSKSHKEIFPPSSVQPLKPNNYNDDVVLADPLDSSRVSGSTSKADFQSLLLTKDVVERYLLVEK
jgi:hypothetical protein